MGPVAYFSFCFLSCLIFNPWLGASPHSVLSRHVRSGIQATFCHTDWLHYKGHCYGFFLEKMTWSEAEMECQNQRKGGHLASIHTSTEGEMVATYIIMRGYKGYVWIGLHDPDHDRNWTWTDGSKYHYTGWRTGEPRNLNNNEFCVELVSDTGLKNWNNANCKSKKAYICKYTL